MAQKYVPKKQGAVGQIIDSLFILVLVYISLMAPLLLGSDSTTSAASSATAAPPTWASLHLSQIAQQQWIKLGYDAKGAAALISTRFDYSINPWLLILTIIVIVGYYFFVLKYSKKEYREVINEKFGEK